MRILSAFEPQLRVDTSRGRATLVDTTGDRRDDTRSVLLPKAAAVMGSNPQGEKFVEVPVEGSEARWVPLDAFQQSQGDDGLLYLPTYKDSPGSAALGGAVKGLLATGPIGALSGAAAGAATAFGKGDKVGKWGKLALGAGAGAVVMAAANAALYGAAGLPVAVALGAVTGIAAVQAGEGEASVRDAAYGGTAAGFAASMITGTPLALLTGSVAAGLGARSRSKTGQVVTAALAGAVMQAGQALLGGGSLPVALAVGASVGALGTLAGPPLMQATRNLSQAGGEVLRKQLAGAPDSALIALSAVPYAASGGFLGATAGMVVPGAGALGAAVGATVGAAFGAIKTYQQVSEMKAAAQKNPSA